MKAVILAAGKGTRMRELTSALPKPMLKLKGKPILEHIIEGLIAKGIREICIVTGFQADVIEDYFGHGEKWATPIIYRQQKQQNGTGKAPEPARDFVGPDPFLLTYGDILVKPDTYEKMIRRFRAGNYAGLLTVKEGEDVTKGGLVFFDDHLCVRRLLEKPSQAQLEALKEEGWLKPGQAVWYNAGIYIFRPILFEFTAALKLSPRGEYELTDAIGAMLEAQQLIAGVEIVGRWEDVRDPEVLARLERETENG